MHEDHGPPPGQHDVRSAGQIALPARESQSMGMQLPAQRLFGARLGPRCRGYALGRGALAVGHGVARVCGRPAAPGGSAQREDSARAVAREYGATPPQRHAPPLLMRRARASAP
ncbi:MAG TPA: hypothetical protein P5163_15190 [Rubrivivax sp.]|nr:hypothetical protein [Rubrivivax sp.]